MIAVRKNLAMDQGASWKQTFRYKNSDGSPIDLAGWTGTFTILKRGTTKVVIDEVALDLSEIDGEKGYLVAYFSDEDTALIEANTYAYTLELETPDGDIERLLYGQFQVRGASLV
ncbi:hypothetical protein [Rhodococcus opacus]|uniref:hypothetical protein n=1 Tax=Rhodococcus opacus TaxID=37919 RepID=UPI0011D0ED9D|nr:hypothetical protein [Rhodococcus opacus]